MCRTRVVITGMGAVTPFGCGVEAMCDALWGGRSAVVHDPQLGQYASLASQVVARVGELDTQWIPRRHRRYMSNMSLFAMVAGAEALGQAGVEVPRDADKRTGLCMGSTTGSTGEYEKVFDGLGKGDAISTFMSTHFFKIMNHSVTANVSQAFGIRGLVQNVSCACATGAVAIGTGFQLISTGLQDTMICGGAEEYHPFTTGIFEIMGAASSRYNDSAQSTPRPFDADRDGVVCAEGAGVVVLESLDHARRAGKPILAEVLSYRQQNGSSHIAHPDADIMADCMVEALADAGVEPDEVDYVNAHATGTPEGDRIESHAIGRVFGGTIPVSSLKGHLGHTMAASGALETIASTAMMLDGRLIGTRNLTHPDPHCAELAYLRGTSAANPVTVVKNSLAMGGVHTTLVLRKWTDDAR